MKKNNSKKNILTVGLLFLAIALVICEPAFPFNQFFSSSLLASPERGKSAVKNNKGILLPVNRKASANVAQQIKNPKINQPRGITINANNEFLVDVLQRIAEQSNISFRVADALSSQRISANIYVADWESGIKELLKDMNRMTVWDKNSRLIQVVLLAGPSVPALPPVPVQPDESDMTFSQNRPQPAAAPPESPANLISLADLSKNFSPNTTPENDQNPLLTKFKKLLQIQPGTQLPADLFNDPDINPFLKENGIQAPIDWKEFSKARVTRKAVHREMRQILAEKEGVPSTTN